MKDNLEKAFKDSLEEFEAPYDPKAWDAVNAQLDAKSASGSSVMSSALKWGVAIALLGAVVTASYFLWYTPETKADRPTTALKQEQQETPPTTQQKETKTEKTTVAEEKSEGKIETSLQPERNTNDVVIKENKSQQNNNTPVKESETKDLTSTTSPDKPSSEKEENGETHNGITENVTQYSVGTISKAVVCFNDEVTISNTSTNEMVRFQHNNHWVELSPHKKYTFIPEASMVINFVNGKDELIEAKYIKVNELPVPSFSYDANIYEKGLPVVVAKADGDYKKYTWTFDKSVERKGAEVNHHFFEKGQYDIVLHVEDANGCRANTSKTVRIQNKYNLMAVDAFKPNGSDIRNRTFMPYSLTEREVRFELTIVDPTDNGVVFTSSDANNPWDGKDQRTGKMTAANKTFIWKVQIFNPVLNERPIYAGTIVHN